MAKKIISPVDAFVGARIKARRLEVSMSQEKLGAAIGLTFQQVQKYEKGSNRVGSSRLMQIANALKVAPAYFFDGSPGAGRKAQDQLASAADGLSEFASSKEGHALIRAFMNVPKDLRRSIVAMVEKIADHQ
jgi:transcriptional regulator with XRE-family HTH domain